MIRRFDRWLRIQAERRWGPLPEWRLTKWIVRTRPLAPIAQAGDRIQEAWKALRGNEEL